MYKPKEINVTNLTQDIISINETTASWNRVVYLKKSLPALTFVPYTGSCHTYPLFKQAYKNTW